jgi:prephenate dehydratase
VNEAVTQAVNEAVTQAAKEYGYLGPSGTFTEAALLQVLPEDAYARPMPTVDAALEAVRSGELAAAVVPIENSVEGGVSATLDALATGSALRITGEMLVPITFVLAARPGTALADVRRVASHPHGWAQCRGWVGSHLPDAAYVPALSTAGAAEGLDPTAAQAPPYDAALCAPLAAERFGLEVLANDVGDNGAAVTRFVLVQRPGAVAPPTGADKTTLVVFQADDHPGGLLEMLEQFATRGINLSWIESRPTGESLGQYSFSIDCEGHIGDARVGEALMGLHRTCREVRWLGSYPRADAKSTVVTDSTTDRAFGEAGDWLRALRSGKG